MADCRSAAMLIKSALRDLLSVSCDMINILVISRCAAPPYPAAPDFPPSGGKNKTPRNILFISSSTVSTGCCATSKRGKGGGVSHQRGNLHRPPGRLYSFRRLWRHKKWRRRRRTSPAQRYFIPPEGGALNPSGRRQPVPDRTFGAQGQRPGGAINPHARKGVSTFGNTGKHHPLSLLNPQAP